MFSFKATFFATLLSGVAASNPKLVSYQPETNVADHTAGISQDQKAIQDLLGFDNENSFDSAQKIYMEGGNSKSYVELQLTAVLSATIKKGAVITGTATNGETTVVGKAFKDYFQGTSTIGVQYPTGDEYSNHVNCRVGGLPVELQVTNGCLINAGAVTITGIAGVVEYTTATNKNGRTIAGFSANADTRFRPATDLTGDYFDFFQPYVTYYGTYDFGDRIATAGFDGADTSLDNGNVALSGYGFRARAEVAKKAAAYINTGLYVQRELYDAMYDCDNQCATAECNDDAVHALDEAVGFFVGSEYVTDPDGVGNLFYGLGQKRAANFATAEDGTSGQAEVNRLLMLEFNDMKAKLSAGKCPESDENAVEIVRLMQIPLVQATLRYAYIIDSAETPTEKAMAEGAVFAAGILPLVHACNEVTATTIYDNMRLVPSQNSKANFKEVKTLLESVYPCMKITCAEVGGLVDPATGTSYYTGAEACGGVAFPSSGAGALSLSMVVGAIAGLVTLLM